MANLSWSHSPGHGRRRRRAVRRRPAGNSQRARDDEPGQPPGARGRSAPRREHRAHHRHGLAPKVSCAARKFATPAARSRCRSARRRSAASSTSSASPSTRQAPSDRRAPPDPCAGSDVRRAGVGSADPRHRHQGRRPARAVRQGRQDRPVRRRRRRQDRADHGADQQRRQGARRLLGVRRRRRAHARGQRPLSRDDRVERQPRSRRRTTARPRAPSAPWCTAR